MSACIFTVIKNEHEYLDEFIKYHLNIGINHLFIFEDIDSDSHKNITDKYNNVTLDRIDNILGNDKDIIINKKLKNKIGYQKTYIIKGLLYIQKNYNYDWCFVLDCDEFITPVNKFNLDIYKDYDAILLFWKIYGANGHIYKPDYSKKGLIDTYTNCCAKLNNYDNGFNTKILFNLHTFKSEYIYNVHKTTNKCKWCKTDLSTNNMYSICYYNIYIRHYITKSFEEYFHKLTIRGMFNPGHRKIETFFIYNEDMKDKKTDIFKIFNITDKDIHNLKFYIQSYNKRG